MKKSESYNDYKRARDIAWMVLIDYHINTLPVDVHRLCRNMGIMLHSYVSGKQYIEDFRLQKFAENNDGFSIKLGDTYCIFYDNNINPPERIKFTIAHEMFHVINGDVDCDNIVCRAHITSWNRGESETPNNRERDANIFASRLLAPACVLHGINIYETDEIMNLCGLSYRAAEIRSKRIKELREREKEWIQMRGYSCFGQSEDERKVMNQFQTFISKFKTKKDNTNIETLEKADIENAFKLLSIGSATAVEYNKEYEFECPICGGIAKVIKTSYNGHLRIVCTKCKNSIIQ